MDSLEILESEGPDNTRILTLTGSLVLSTLFDFQNIVRKIEGPRLIVNMEAVEYVDSAGLGCLLSALASSQRNGRKFALACVPPRVQSLFKMTNVDMLLPQYETVAAAQEHVSANAATT